MEGMTRARERGRSGRFGGGDGDWEGGTSSLAVSCWEDEWGVGLGGIFGGEKEEERRGRGREEGFVWRVRRLGALAGGVGKLGVQAACFVDFRA